MYSPELRTEVYCFRLNFNITKLLYLLYKSTSRFKLLLNPLDTHLSARGGSRFLFRRGAPLKDDVTIQDFS